MKTIGERFGWIIPGKEQRVLKLLRAYKLRRQQEFVARSASVPRRKGTVRIRVAFAREELSAFEVAVRSAPSRRRRRRALN
jgi:hypothetical protein